MPIGEATPETLTTTLKELLAQPSLADTVTSVTARVRLELDDQYDNIFSQL